MSRVNRGTYTHPNVPCPTFVNFSYFVTSGQNGKLWDVRDAIPTYHAELRMRNLDDGHVFERGWAGKKWRLRLLLTQCKSLDGR